ncbi:MAG TPA: hypothetical protein VL134_10750 [Leptolyngbya sp.]|jgi:hypothetical protein|nr:hypothetical protein [Leptolyngbya sp.]
MLNVSQVDHDLIEDSSFSESEVFPARLNSDATSLNPWRYVKTVNRRPYRSKPFDHAAPLSPLRDRDLEIMAGWFDFVDMAEVEQDVNHQLSLLYPEPPWEESLDFLRGHL